MISKNRSSFLIVNLRCIPQIVQPQHERHDARHVSAVRLATAGRVHLQVAMDPGFQLSRSTW